MKLLKAGQLQRGHKVSINGVLLEVQRVIPTGHKDPSVLIAFSNGTNHIANVNQDFYVQFPEGETSVNNYDGHQQNNFGQYQPVQPQQPVQQTPPNSHKQKKPFFRRTWVIVTGAILAAFVIIGIAGGGDSTPTGSSVPSGGVTSSGAPADKPTKKATPKPAAKKWVKLVTLSGKADKSSDTIKTTGGKLRITYSFTDPTNSGIIVAAVYVLKEGVDPMKDGAIPDVMVSEPGKDVTTIRRDSGEYYVRITAANTKYTVTVEEEK